ncbi:MAG: PQQ-like beta-propeller repeat protein [Thermosipho sp. (in: Bacteria)]|nr:PQQ-like beta-propeller repeat protein [Thermosipho sp. (in: thermotogales)]
MKKKFIGGIILIAIAMLILFSCTAPQLSSNSPPNPPSNSFPLNNATNVTITPTLLWECSDPDGDSLSYDIYFGTDPEKLPVIKDDHPSTKLVLETIPGYRELQNETTYYWMVVAKDSKGGVTPSSIWKFTTCKPARLKWKFETYDTIYGGLAVATDGTIYIGSFDNNLYAINPDGSLKWKYQTGDYVWETSPTIGSDGTIYIVTSGKLFAVNSDGSLKWSYDHPFGGQAESPTIGEDGTIYLGGAYGFYAFNPDDGSVRWAIGDARFEDTSPSIGPDGTIYIGSYDTNYLYAINPDGTLKWKFEANYVFRSSPAIGEDGTIYVGSDDDYLYAINPDGTLKWKFETGDDIRTSPVIGEDGTIYVGSFDGYLYAINPDGSMKWNFETGYAIQTNPVIGEDGTIYVGVYKYIYAINSDGTLSWKYENFSRSISYSHLGLSNDGTLYVPNWDGCLYAIETDSPGLANSPWPKFQKNNRNTGNYNDVE